MKMGGVVGGINTFIDGATFYSGGSYEGRFQNALIINGRLYYKAPLSDQVSTTATGGGAYTCRDLRTGEIIWTTTTSTRLSLNSTLMSHPTARYHSKRLLWQAVEILGLLMTH